jgi:hypothetical protein
VPEGAAASSVFHKTWNDMMKGKNDKRKKVLRHHFSEIITKQINKVNYPKMSTKMHIHLGKGQGKNLYNVGDVR